jgi:hypothetical protein
MKNVVLAASIGVLAIGIAGAQEGPRFTFGVGGGFTTPVGNTGRQLDNGWNIGGGFGVNFVPWVGANINLNYNSWGINSATLNTIGAPGGGMHVFSATLDPIVHLNPKGHVDFYLTGGGGLYHRIVDFTAPSVAVVPGFDPFFGFFPVEVPTTQILSSYSVNKPGVDVGAGVAFGTKYRGKIFAEAKYNRIYLGRDVHADYIPVTFGFRW